VAVQYWWSLFTAAFGGGATLKLFDIAHQEYKSWKTDRTSNLRSVDQSLEPLLRSADELVGKLSSLAKQDFIPIRDTDIEYENGARFDSVVYLFMQFWSEVEIVRSRGLSTAVAKTQRGKQTQAFLICLESRRLRLIDRNAQRALGEAALVNGKTMNFVEFEKSIDSDPYMMRWLKPLLRALDDLNNAHGRQRMLQYAVVLHAMIDTLDKDHLVTRQRPATPNKLSKRSWRELNYRVFRVYLTFVSNRTKYIGPQS
jgi:hypothetical protein